MPEDSIYIAVNGFNFNDLRFEAGKTVKGVPEKELKLLQLQGIIKIKGRR